MHVKDANDTNKLQIEDKEKPINANFYKEYIIKHILLYKLNSSLYDDLF